MKRQLIFLLIVVYLISIVASIPTDSVRAATVVVTNINDSGTGSLRQILIDAASGDTIIFDSSLSGQTIRLQSNLTINKNITIDGSALSEKIILNGDSDNNGDGDILIVNILANRVVSIKNVEFTKGYRSSSLSAGAIENLGILSVYSSEFNFNIGDQGGAIRNSDHLYVEDSIFTDNTATEGGAILNNLNAEAEIRNSVFSNNTGNTVYGVGGAIANIETMSIYNSEFINNNATVGGGAITNSSDGTTIIFNNVFTNNSTLGYGGAINNLEGTVNIYQSTFSNNSANYGGAIIAGKHLSSYDTITVISESVISNNQATGGGGGIEFDSGTSMSIDKTTISGNTALAGGGIVNVSGNLLIITNSTIANNTATQSPQPGGIISLHSPVTIKNSTFTGNNHTSVGIQGDAVISNTTIAGNPGYGLEVFTYSLSITNSILANNGNSDCRIQSGATLTTNQNNLIETNSGCGIPALTSDPDLQTLATNGGPTQTMALPLDSPAINAGNNATCETTDQRGITRPYGSHCDIGAYEYKANAIITNTNNSGEGSLRQVLADSIPEDTILFDASLSGQTISLLSTIIVDKDITIDASALSEKIVLSGDSDNDGDGDILIVNINTDKTVVIKNLKFTKGYSPLSTSAGAIENRGNLSIYESQFESNLGSQGGAIRNSGELHVENSSFANNSALKGGAVVNAEGMLDIYGSTFTENSAYEDGGAINNLDGRLTITESTFSGNSGDRNGGGIANFGTLTVTNSILSDNSAHLGGGGIANLGTLTITNSNISGNSTSPLGGGGGGILNYNNGILAVMNSTISTNFAPNGGGIINLTGSVTISNSTLSENLASSGNGGGISSFETLTVTNSTLFGNSATEYAGGILSTGTLTLKNNTVSGNSALLDGGGIANFGILNYTNTIIANSLSGGDCTNDNSISININNLVEDGGCTSALIGDPLLGLLADNGGSTQTMALLPGSPAVDAGDDVSCEDIDQRGVARPQNGFCDIGAYEVSLEDADVYVYVEGSLKGNYDIMKYDHLLQSYPGQFGGPVLIDSTNVVPVVTSLRLMYNNKTFSELMGVPTSQLLDDYWMPVYIDNSTTDSQIRFTNTSTTQSTTVQVYIGGILKGTYPLGPSSAERIRYPEVSGGPVQIVGTPGVPILAGMRVIYGGTSSFDEIMAYPTTQLTYEYWFPFYNHNNVNLDTEVRIANTSAVSSSTVTVYIGNSNMGSYILAPLTSRLVSYPGISGGPVRIAGTTGVPLVTSLRLLYNNKTFSELMGVPTAQLLDDYSMPVYIDDAKADSQIRFTNTSAVQSTTVSIYFGGVFMGSYPLAPQSAQRVRFAGITGGPVRIVGTSGVPILAGMRIIYGGTSSFDEIMAYPTSQLESQYWFPFYNHNNINLDTEVRIGVP